MSTSEYKPKRVFTVEEANKMLPLVQRIVADIQRCYSELVADAKVLMDARVAEAESRQPPSLDEEIDSDAELGRRRDLLAEYLRELTDLGIELKQPSIGLIDFPSLRDGRIVYLCWKLGEPRVEYWHELDAGFRGRQPLEGSAVDSAAGQ